MTKQKPQRQTDKFAYAKIKTMFSSKEAIKKAKRKNVSECKEEEIICNIYKE